MKVLFVSHSAGLGGAERGLVELAQALVRLGEEPIVVLPREGPLAALLRDIPVETLRIRHRSWANLRTPLGRRGWSLAVNLVAVARLRAVMVDRRPDVVVTGTSTVPAAAVAARASGLPHIWYVQEFGVEDHGSRFHFGRARTMRLIDRLSIIVMACSNSVANHLTRWIDADKVGVLTPCAFDTAPLTALEPRSSGADLRLLLAGTKLEGKGQKDALAALRSLAERGVPARLRLVGPGLPDYVRRLKRQARQLGVDDSVDFVDEVVDLRPELKAADILLSCARAEAFGRTTVEAMREGVPVVGARAAGTEEQLVESGGGLLYEPGDVEGLVAAVERLYREPELRRQCGQAGAAWVSQFSFERYGTEFLRIAEEAIDRHHRRARARS